MPELTITQHLRRIDSPIGRLELTSDGKSITSLSIERKGHLPNEEQEERTNRVLDRAVKQLAEYFAGRRRTFNLPIAPGGTEFQRQVWTGLASIPWGTAWSYGELGASTGRASAGRAVGGAVGSNPLPIIIPCHRVLASDGKITGYSGGNGVPTKAWLLEHEGIPYRLPNATSAAPALLELAELA
jgi:methylated-DNA-[protein]-cysteine S-methyltransferase